MPFPCNLNPVYYLFYGFCLLTILAISTYLLACQVALILSLVYKCKYRMLCIINKFIYLFFFWVLYFLAYTKHSYFNIWAAILSRSLRPVLLSFLPPSSCGSTIFIASSCCRHFLATFPLPLAKCDGLVPLFLAPRKTATYNMLEKWTWRARWLNWSDNWECNSFGISIKLPVLAHVCHFECFFLQTRNVPIIIPVVWCKASLETVMMMVVPPTIAINRQEDSESWCLQAFAFTQNLCVTSQLS